MECRVCKEEMDRHWLARTCAPCCSLINQYIVGRALAAVAKAIKDGSLPKLTGAIKCVDCNKPAKHYDHRDYFKPLEVNPVCISCNQKRGVAQNRENLVEGIQRFISDLRENKATHPKSEGRIRAAQRVLQELSPELNLVINTIQNYINNLLDWGWTQTELARRFETTQPTIHRWSTGTGTDYETFQKVEELWKQEKKKSDKRKAR